MGKLSGTHHLRGIQSKGYRHDAFPSANTGQVCVAPTRLRVPRARYTEAIATAGTLKVGDPVDPATRIGPLSSRVQFDKVQQMIATVIGEGARLVAGGLGLPEELERGFFVRPTIFATYTTT